jgi:hypothetical protein
MLIYLGVVLCIAIGLAVWSHDNEKRQRTVAFWTGGLGVLGVMAIGCATIILVHGAYVFDDSLRAVQIEAGTIDNAVTKLADKVGRGVGTINQLVST